MHMQTGTDIDTRLFVGGEFLEAEGGRTFQNRDPYTDEVVSEVAAASREDARRAVEAAAAAFPEWSQTPPAVRQGVFLKAADVLESRQDEVVSLLARETGCTFGFGMFQMHFVPGLFRQAAALAYAPLGEVIPSDTGAFAMGVRRPVGVVGAIAPWNAALILSARSIAAALALGNTVVLKPSEWSPQVGGLLWGEVFAEAGLPAGVLNIVTHAPGEAGPIGDELVENPAVRRLNFTGSTATGRRLARGGRRASSSGSCSSSAATTRWSCSDDADLQYAVDASAFGAFLHQGQICMSARRIIVERPIADEFVSRLAAKTQRPQGRRPKEHDTIIGPLINGERGRDRQGAGRTRPCRGRDAARRRRDVEGPCCQATLLADVPADSELATMETFGPVAAIEVVDSAEEAVAARERDGVRALVRDHHVGHRARLRARAGDRRRASSTSTTSRSATSRRCRSAASRTRASDGSAGRRSSTSSRRLRWITVQRGSHPFPF